MKQVKCVKFAVAVAIVAISGAASATDSGTGTLGVSASIIPECHVAQNTAIDFGGLHALSGLDENATGSIDAICTNGTTQPTFSYSSANGAFQLKGGTTATDVIAYSLYQDINSTGTAVTYNSPAAYPGFTADGTTKTLNLTAHIIAADKTGKSVQAYTDTITVTTAFQP